MKTLYTLLSLSLIVLMSCEKADEYGLEGKWYVQNVSGGFAGVDYTYDRGVAVWDFDPVQDSLRIRYQIDSNDAKYDYLPIGTGSHHYTEYKKNIQLNKSANKPFD